MTISSLVLSRTTATIFVIASAFVNTATADINSNYQECLVRSKAVFSASEKSMIKGTRAQFDRQLKKYRVSNSYEVTFAHLLKVYEGSITAKSFTVFQSIAAEAGLARWVDRTAGLRDSAYLAFVDFYDRALFGQKEINLKKFEAARQELVSAIVIGSMNKKDQSMGLTVPLTMTPQDPEAISSALTSINLLSELVYRSQSTNMDIRKDGQRYLRARVRQAAFGAGGFAVLMGTIYFGPGVLAAGAAGGKSLGLATLVGEMGAGSAIGAAGGAAAEGVKLAYEIVSRSYFLSLEKNTPFSCELQKTVDQESVTNALLHGAAFGGSVGAGGTALATLIPKISLWLMGGAVAVGQTNEIGSLAYEFYQMKVYYDLAQELTSLERISGSQADQQRELVQLVLTQARRHAKNAGQHSVDAMIVGTLTKAFFIDGEFKHALHQGAQVIKGLAAFSSDTLPSVAMSVASLGAKGISFVKNPTAVGAEAKLFSRTQTFIQLVNGQNSAMEPRLEFRLN
jgi:hypothetical protein